MNIDRFKSFDVVLVCGLQGAGKSHFSRKYFKDSERKRINRKEIRRLIYEMTNFGDAWDESKFNEKNEYLVKHVETKIYEHYLFKNEKILIDDTSLTIKSRQHYIEKARKEGKSVGIIFLNTPIKKCLERNKQSDTPLNPTIITNLYSKIELPKEPRKEKVNAAIIIEDY